MIKEKCRLCIKPSNRCSEEECKQMEELSYKLLGGKRNGRFHKTKQ